jgi:predicted transcriptional regulator
MIQEGLDDVTAGRLVPMEQARAWANSLGTDSELPVPKA